MYKEHSFSIPAIVGISQKTVDEHLKLYSGYVKNANLILEKIDEYAKEADKHAYAISELQRRFGFEFNGMRNHEYYFKSLEGGPAPLGNDSALKTAIEGQWGSVDALIAKMKTIAMTRGIGWAILYYDNQTEKLTLAWIDEQHLGQLNGLSYITGIDMWEHSFYLDYATDKKKYVDAFFAAVNWTTADKNFTEAAA